VPLLVHVLAGNSVTSLTILSCLNTVDMGALRRLFPAVADVVAAVPWCDMDTAVLDAVRWRAAFPAAVGARVPADDDLLPPALAALAGVTHLDLRGCKCVTDELLLLLPPSLRTLNISGCENLSERANLVHLTALTALDCGTHVLDDGVAGLPPSLQELEIRGAHLPAGASLAHLAHLRVLRASYIDAATLRSLPSGLVELLCSYLPAGASFAHFPALHTLGVYRAAIDDGSLASMPPSLVSLHICECTLTHTAVLPPLPALRLLDVSDTDIGDALVASLPADLTELRMAGCRGVTPGATLGHVRALQLLHSYGTDLAPGVLAACRARGCAVPTAGVLRGHGGTIVSFALLADGRLASVDVGGEVRLWDLAAGEGKVVTIVRVPGDTQVVALAALQDGHRLVAGAYYMVEIWDVGVVPPVRTATVNCSGTGGVRALVVLRDGHLAAVCYDGSVRIIDADAGAVTATLKGHSGGALAALPTGALASGSTDKSVQVWDVGARACVATLAGHTGWINALVALPDGRLASGSDDHTVRLWDVGARACVGVLTGHTGAVIVLAVLPDGRLVSGSTDGSIRVWDTRPAATAPAGHAAGTVAHGLTEKYWGALLPLPDGRLACAVKDVVQLLHVSPPASYR